MASVRKFRENWVADYRDQWGKRHREKPEGHFDNKAQQKRAAHTLLKKRLDDVDRGTYSRIAQNLTFSKLADLYLESKVNIRPSTRRNYESVITLYLKPYFGTWKVRQISAADIEHFRNGFSTGVPTPIRDAFAKRIRESRPALSQARAQQRAKTKTLSPRSVNKALTLLVMIFNYASRHRWIDFNPAKHVEKLKELVSTDGHPIDTNVLSPEEIRRLLNAAEPAHRDKGGMLRSNNYRLLIQFAIFTGVRSGEIRGVTLIGLHVKSMFVDHGKKGSSMSRKQRHQPVELTCQKHLFRISGAGNLHALPAPMIWCSPISQGNH